MPAGVDVCIRCISVSVKRMFLRAIRILPADGQARQSLIDPRHGQVYAICVVYIVVACFCSFRLCAWFCVAVG